MMVHLAPLAQDRLNKAERANPDVRIVFEALKMRLAHDPLCGATPIHDMPHSYIIAVPHEIASDDTVMIKNLFFR
jgi:hypothetical protein